MSIENERLGWCAGSQADCDDATDPCATPDEAVAEWLSGDWPEWWRDRMHLPDEDTTSLPDSIYVWLVERPNHLLRGEDHAETMLETLANSDEAGVVEIDWPPMGEAGRRQVEGAILPEILYTDARKRLHEAIEKALLDYLEAETGVRGVSFWIAVKTFGYRRNEDGKYIRVSDGEA